jgi:hypothetical protein
MAENNWLGKCGQDAESRAKRIRMCRRIKAWGQFFIFSILAATIYVIFLEQPQSSSDAFLFAIAFGVCFSAGFTLLTSMETEIKLLQLVDELKKPQS